MTTLSQLKSYKDDRNNEIVYSGVIHLDGKVLFRGRNNRIILDATVKVGRLIVEFDCDNGLLQIGGNSGVASFKAYIRVGQDSSVVIGDDVSSTGPCAISAVEGTSVVIGNDVMIASDNEIKADDAHPIFDVSSGLRVNFSKSVEIGDHVWLAKRAVVLSGSRIGAGSVIGYGSLVKGNIPNNCVASGVPARVIRRDIAWERPHLSLSKPYYKPDASCVARSEWWRASEDID